MMAFGMKKEPFLPRNLALVRIGTAVFHGQFNGTRLCFLLKTKVMNTSVPNYKRLKSIYHAFSGRRDLKSYINCQTLVSSSHVFVFQSHSTQCAIFVRDSVVEEAEECMSGTAIGQQWMWMPAMFSAYVRTLQLSSITREQKFLTLVLGAVLWISWNKLDRITHGGKKDAAHLERNKTAEAKDCVLMQQLNVMDFTIHCPFYQIVYNVEMGLFLRTCLSRAVIDFVAVCVCV